MKIGYACQCLSNTIPSFRTCTKKFASEENLISIISHNLKVLDQILEHKLSQQGINHAFLAVLEKVRHQEDYLFLCGISE